MNLTEIRRPREVICWILGGHYFEALISRPDRYVYAPPCTVCGNKNNPHLEQAEPGWYVNTEPMPVDERARRLALGTTEPGERRP